MSADECRCVSDVFRTVRLTGRDFFDVVANTPWVAESPPREELSELMFIEVVRRHLEALPPEQAGWLAGLRDPFVGKALSLMHGGSARNWTIEDLARNIATVAAETGYGSEAAFSRAFKKIVGVPPSAWRRRVRADA